MTRLIPILASEATAAALLDMPVTKFHALVAAGNLPKAREIAPGVYRWSHVELRAIGSGALARPNRGLEL